MDFSTLRQQCRRDTRHFLLHYLQRAAEDEDLELMSYIRSRLKRITMEDSKGLVIRSKVRENIDDERLSLFHLNREMKKGKKSSLSKLCKTVNKKRIIMEDQEEIHGMAVNFFSSLFQGYHTTNGEIRDFPFSPSFERLDFFLKGLGSLSTMEAEGMIEEITLEEVEDVVKNSSNNKSPGLDGLNYEFYKSQLPLMGPILVNVLNFQLSHLSLLPSNLIKATLRHVS